VVLRCVAWKADLYLRTGVILGKIPDYNKPVFFNAAMQKTNFSAATCIAQVIAN
jgi:hypothetical protein